MSTSSTPAESRSFERWRTSMATLTGMGRIRSPNEPGALQTEEDRATMESHWNRCEAWKKSLMTDSKAVTSNRRRTYTRSNDRIHAQTPRLVWLSFQLFRHSMSPMSGNNGWRVFTRAWYSTMSKSVLLEKAHGGHAGA